MIAEPVLIFKASKYYGEKIHLKLINNEGLSSLSGANSKITASIMQTSPPPEFKRKHGICNTSRQSLLSLCFCLGVFHFVGFFFCRGQGEFVGFFGFWVFSRPGLHHPFKETY